MVRRERRVERLRRSQTDVSPEALQTALEGAGFTLVHVRGSHWRYRHPRRDNALVIPYRRPVKRAYVRDALKAIDEVMRHDDG